MSGYSLVMTDEQNAPMLTAFFRVDLATNTVTAFHNVMVNPETNILGTNDDDGADYLYDSASNKFSMGGVNITAFPYYSERGDTSSWFNLSTIGAGTGFYQYGPGDYVQSEFQFMKETNNEYVLTPVKMTITPWFGSESQFTSTNVPEPSNGYGCSVL